MPPAGFAVITTAQRLARRKKSSPISTISSATNELRSLRPATGERQPQRPKRSFPGGGLLAHSPRPDSGPPKLHGRGPHHLHLVPGVLSHLPFFRSGHPL